jgi:FMN reductase
MTTIATVSASPTARSRSAGTRRHVDERLIGLGHTVYPLDVRDLPAEPLLAADTAHPDIARAARLIEQADGVVIVTPVYKAAYSGLLKTLLDLLPQSGLAGKVVLPLATGGSLAHVLVLDYALRPVLSSLGAGEVVQGYFLLDRDIVRDEEGRAGFADETREALSGAVDRFTRALDGRRRLGEFERQARPAGREGALGHGAAAAPERSLSAA